MPQSGAAARLVGLAVVGVARLLTGVRAYWHRDTPQAAPTLYVANHTSHADFVLLWSSLPPALRRVTRPVAAADYWQASGFRRFIGERVFRALLIRRDKAAPAAAEGFDPVQQMAAALRAGQSLILFPEGTRNTSEAALLPFKSGLYHLARACPEVRVVPVWIDNLNRVLPKGMLVPLPLACSVSFGATLALQLGEDQRAYLARAQAALLALRPAPALHFAHSQPGPR